MRAFSDDDNAETDWTWAFEAVEVGAGVATGDDEDVEVVWTWEVEAAEVDAGVATSDDEDVDVVWTWAVEAAEVGAGVAASDDEDVEVVWTWAVAATEADEDCEAVGMVTGDTCNRAVDRVGFAIDDKETRDVALVDPIREPGDEEKMLLLICFSIWY